MVVAGQVPVGVVDPLEVVEVEHDQAERRAVANGLLQVLAEGGVVEQPGQPVGLGAHLDVAEDLRVLDGDGHLGREQLDELELLGREQVARPQTLDGQHADGPVPAAQRDDDEAAVDGLDLAEVVDPRVVALVGDVDRLVVLDDPRREAGLALLPRLQVLRGVQARGPSAGSGDRSPGRRPRWRCCRSR